MMMPDMDYEVTCRLGEGAFGKVYKAEHKRTGDFVAVKQIKLGTSSWDEACRSPELQALRTLRHPFIVRLRELIRSQSDGSLYYIFEFVDSDLCRLVKENPNGLDETRTAELARQLFAGLAHMHQHNFFHRDIKPENILLDSARETIRIADFGQARSLRARPPFTDYVGTRWYRAPECLLRDRTYSSPADVWAAGLIFAELMRGSPLFCGTSTIDQLFKIFVVLGQPLADWADFARLAQSLRFRPPDRCGCGVTRILPNASAQVVTALTDILQLNPRRRPLARKCLDHTFFSFLPALDLEKLDTHRGRPSDEQFSDEKTEPPSSARTEPSQLFSPMSAEDVDLDAELDKILGNDGSPRTDAMASPLATASDLLPPPMAPQDAAPEQAAPVGTPPRTSPRRETGEAVDQDQGFLVTANLEAAILEAEASGAEPLCAGGFSVTAHLEEAILEAEASDAAASPPPESPRSAVVGFVSCGDFASDGTTSPEGAPVGTLLACVSNDSLGIAGGNGIASELAAARSTLNSRGSCGNNAAPL